MFRHRFPGAGVRPHPGRLLPRTLSSAASAAALLAVTACGSGPAPAEPLVWPIPRDLVGQDVTASWTDLSATEGGFSSPDFDATPSLYATSWNLRTLRLIGRTAPGLVPDRAADRLRTVIRDRTPVAGMSTLDSLAGAALGLRALGAEVPARELRGRIGALRTGGLYRPDPASPPTWASTATAIETLAAAGLDAPAEVAARVRAELRSRATPTADLDTMVNTLVPLWQAADAVLPAAQRRPYAAGLDALVDRLAAGSERIPGGPRLAVLADLTDIAAANGRTGPSVRPDLSGLRTPSGLLALGAGSAVPDPHVTFEAVRIGYRLDAQSVRALTATALPDGWDSPGARPDATSSYWGALLCGVSRLGRHREQLEAFARHRLDAIARDPGRARRQDLTELHDDLRLLRLLDRPVPAADRHAVTAAVLGAAYHDPLDADRALRVLRLLGVRPPASWSARLRDVARGPGTAATALLAFDLGTLTGDGELRTLARKEIAELGAGPAYRRQAGSSEPDLESTAMALHILAAPVVRYKAAAAVFRDREGTHLLPAGPRRNPVTLATLGIGAELSRGLDPYALET